MAPFITFEGIEGSGKSSQLKRLAQRLKQASFQTLETREPGGCPIADQIRGILLHPTNAAMDARAELLLYAAARAQHIEQIVRPALTRGQIVLCDRFTDATIAYQGHGRQLDLQLIEQLNELATGNCHPDLTLLFDLPIEIGLQRARQREIDQQDNSEGRFEREALDFHQRVREAYLQLAQAAPQRIKIVDAARTPDEVSQQIWQFVEQFLLEQRAAL